MTTLIAAPVATTIDNAEIAAAAAYCHAEPGWYLQAKVAASGRRVEFWLHWCTNRAGLDALIAADKGCIDFTPCTWADNEAIEASWQAIENIEDHEIPDDSLYFCRYLVTDS